MTHKYLLLFSIVLTVVIAGCTTSKQTLPEVNVTNKIADIVDLCSSLNFSYQIDNWKDFNGYKVLINNSGVDINEDVEINRIVNDTIASKQEFLNWKSNEIKSIQLNSGENIVRIKPETCLNGTLLTINIPTPTCSVDLIEANWSGNWNDAVFFKINSDAPDELEQGIRIEIKAKASRIVPTQTGQTTTTPVTTDSEEGFIDYVALHTENIKGSGYIQSWLNLNKHDYFEYTNELIVSVSSSQCQNLLERYSLDKKSSFDTIRIQR